MSRVVVVVLGDLARSPRMLNHAVALDARGHEVTLIGYREKPLLTPPRVRVRALSALRAAPKDSGRARFLLQSALRMGLLFFELVAELLRARPQRILVQNPPSFPTLLAARIAAALSGARWIVDWHNYGYSMLALRLGAGHRIVRWSAAYEGWAGRGASAHLCVSRAMQVDLLQRFKVQARVLYDRPVAFSEGGVPAAGGVRPEGGVHSAGGVRPEGREHSGPLVAVCPSGWTADEDMKMLFHALALLAARPSASTTSPASLELHLTGDGPLRVTFDPQVAALRERGLDIRTGFLSEADYRALVARADLGLSLHHSTSGLDLAMKVADLYAARVPVCAWNYGGSLPEQIEDGVTGFLFDDASGLAAVLRELLDDPTPLAAMRESIARIWKESWDRAWENNVAGLF